MPISLSAKRSLRKAEKNHKVNVAFKRKLKELVKAFLSKPSKNALISVESILDKAVKKQLFHRNKVARLKSQYIKKLEKKDEVKPTKAAVKINKTAAKRVAAKKIATKKATSKRAAKKMS